MAKSLQEVFDEIKIDLTGERATRTFSKTAFDKLAKALVNEVDHTVNVASTKGGEMQLEEVKPVQKFRHMLQDLLQQFGVDKQESARILDASCEIKNVDGLYELTSELIYQYTSTGRKYDFLPREDFSGSVTLVDVPEKSAEYKRVRPKDYTGPEEIFSVETKAHKQIKAKSKAPGWMKTRLK